MTDNDDTGQPARLPALEKGLRFRDRGRLGKLPDEASGPEWAAMLQGTGYGSGAWWGHKINRAIRQRDLKATTRGIIKRTEILRWLEQYDAVPDGWRTLTVHTPATSASTSSSVSEKAAPVSERTILGEMADYLPLREQARLGCLPDALHVEQIATLEYPDNRYLALAYANALIDACSNKEMVFTRKQYEYWWIENGATDEVSEEFGWWLKVLQEKTEGHCSTPLITRPTYRDWLLQKGLPLPTWWFPAAVTNPSTSTASNPVVPTPSASVPGTGRQIALVEAEDAALTLLRKQLRREPDFEEFWFHITEHDDTGTVAESTDDRLMWIGKDGRNCETSKSTMRNRLAASKKRNPFGR